MVKFSRIIIILFNTTFDFVWINIWLPVSCIWRCQVVKWLLWLKNVSHDMQDLMHTIVIYFDINAFKIFWNVNKNHWWSCTLHFRLCIQIGHRYHLEMQLILCAILLKFWECFNRIQKIWTRVQKNRSRLLRVNRSSIGVFSGHTYSSQIKE